MCIWVCRYPGECMSDETLIFADPDAVGNPFGSTDPSLAPFADQYVEGRVSVITPCHNAEAFLRASIESALEQSYENVELIVVDDGSTDGSRAIIDTYGEKIRTISSDRHGASAARNRALRIAQGEFIQFLDADDVLHPDAISLRIGAMRGDEGAVFSGYNRIDQDGSRLEHVSFPTEGLWSAGDAVSYLLDNPGRLLTLAPLHRRRRLYEMGGFDASLPRWQDSNLHLRLAAAGHYFRYIPGVVGGYRVHTQAGRLSADDSWLKDDPALPLKLIANHYRALLDSQAGEGDAELRDRFARLLERYIPRVCVDASMEWGERYMREAMALRWGGASAVRDPLPVKNKLDLMCAAQFLRLKRLVRGGRGGGI